MSKYDHPLFDVLRADAYITSNKSLRWALGTHEADIYAELLSRHFYFEERGELTVDGYFFNTVSSLRAGTALNRKAQSSAIKKLRMVGLIDIVLRDAPPKRYFKIINDPKTLSNLIAKGKEMARKAFDDAKEAKRDDSKRPKGTGNKKSFNNTDASPVPSNGDGKFPREVYDNYRPM